MGLFIASLNSGSNGNCYYIGNGRESILVDAGLSCRETERRLIRLGRNIQTVKGIIISHEHTDHIKGMCVLAKKYALPVFLTSKTYKALNVRPDRVHFFQSGRWMTLGAFQIFPFDKHHDACDPHSFLVSGEAGTTIGVFTDIGTVCTQLIRCFQYCHAAFLEANYDKEMLEQGRYPFYLKKRISGGRGHLSNTQALKLFQEHKPSFMTHLILAHLSQENNRPERVASLFAPHAGNTHIHVASRVAESPLFYINSGQENAATPSRYALFSSLGYPERPEVG